MYLQLSRSAPGHRQSGTNQRDRDEISNRTSLREIFTRHSQLISSIANPGGNPDRTSQLTNTGGLSMPDARVAELMIDNHYSQLMFFSRRHKGLQRLPVTGAGLALERPGDILRYPATVKRTRLRLDLLTVNAAINTARIERNTSVDRSKALVWARIAPGYRARRRV